MSGAWYTESYRLFKTLYIICSANSVNSDMMCYVGAPPWPWEANMCHDFGFYVSCLFQICGVTSAAHIKKVVVCRCCDNSRVCLPHPQHLSQSGKCCCPPRGWRKYRSRGYTVADVLRLFHGNINILN